MKVRRCDNPNCLVSFPPGGKESLSVKVASRDLLVGVRAPERKDFCSFHCAIVWMQKEMTP